MAPVLIVMNSMELLLRQLAISALLLLMCLPVLASDTSASICSTFYSRAGTPSRQIYPIWLNPSKSLPPNRMVSFNIWRTWGANDYLRFDQQLLAFEPPRIDIIKSTSKVLSRVEKYEVWPVVEILSFQKLDSHEQKAVQRIASEVHYRQQVLELGMVLLRTKKGLVLSRFIENNEAVNVSSDKVQAAISNMINQHQLSSQDIKEIQFFHNHPLRGPLSQSDINAGRGLKYYLQQNLNIDVAIQIYSFADFDGSIIINHWALK